LRFVVKKKVFVLGVCGKTASGKSEVLKVLAGLGWKVLDADKIVHDLYRAGREGQRRIADFFGEEFISKNGNVNRRKLLKVVFGDRKKLKILNALIHPLVINEIRKFIDSCEDSDKVAVEAFYFEEKGLGKVVDKILFIERPLDEIKKSLNDRGVDGGLVGEILDMIPVSIRTDIVLENNSTLKTLQKKVIMALEKSI